LVTRTLTAEDFDAVHAAFLDAFSDYVISLAFTREQFAELLTRRGWLPEASVGIFDGERLVAFTLNAVDGARAYDSGTGVVLTHRRRGLGRAMLDFIEPRLRARGCTEYVLEVLEQNQRALELYRSSGFEVARGLQCWRYGGAAAPPEGRSSIHPEWWDVQPSWQNTAASIGRARDPHVILGDAHGYAVVFPSNGDLAQLAVAREARRRGVGTRLLRQAQTLAGKPLRILNVDDRDAGIAAFLEHASAAKTVRQYEMIKRL
jgi:ribosomal protein S18 acetylase RimI-like enzyme